jgi:hypothetical protein
LKQLKGKIMALKQKISTVSGIEVDDAYHRVEQVSLVNKSNISFAVNAYKDSENKTYITSKFYSCQYDLAGKNPIAQAYAHLKTLEEFAGAEDC